PVHRPAILAAARPVPKGSGTLPEAFLQMESNFFTTFCKTSDRDKLDLTEPAQAHFGYRSAATCRRTPISKDRSRLPTRHWYHDRLRHRRAHANAHAAPALRHRARRGTDAHRRRHLRLLGEP